VASISRFLTPEQAAAAVGGVLQRRRTLRDEEPAIGPMLEPAGAIKVPGTAEGDPAGDDPLSAVSAATSSAQQDCLTPDQDRAHRHDRRRATRRSCHPTSLDLR
jgi:hypothetical protein